MAAQRVTRTGAILRAVTPATTRNRASSGAPRDLPVEFREGNLIGALERAIAKRAPAPTPKPKTPEPGSVPVVR